MRSLLYEFNSVASDYGLNETKFIIVLSTLFGFFSVD
jgi:hypothetical protein